MEHPLIRVEIYQTRDPEVLEIRVEQMIEIHEEYGRETGGTYRRLVDRRSIPLVKPSSD